MPFQLTEADQDALKFVDIVIDGDGTSVPNFRLYSETLMFPPIVTKDTKTAKWLEVQSGSFEPFKYYVQSESRQLGLEFQWVTGRFNGGKFTPLKLHSVLSKIKSYFYGAYFANDREEKSEYPRVLIRQLYEVVPTVRNARNNAISDGRAISGNDDGEGGATFRMMNVNIKYSKELVRVGGNWYPLHVKLGMNLESVSKLKNEKDDVPFKFSNLIDRPFVEWF